MHVSWSSDYDTLCFLELGLCMCLGVVIMHVLGLCQEEAAGLWRTELQQPSGSGALLGANIKGLAGLSPGRASTAQTALPGPGSTAQAALPGSGSTAQAALPGYGSAPAPLEDAAAALEDGTAADEDAGVDKRPIAAAAKRKAWRGQLCKCGASQLWSVLRV